MSGGSRCASVVLVLLAFHAAWTCGETSAQSRLQFANPDPNAYAQGPITYAPGDGGFSAVSPGAVVTPAPGTNPFAAPVLQPQPGYAAPTYAAPTYAAPPAAGAWTAPQPPGAVSLGPAPMATLNGNVQPVAPTWDPFAPPGSTPPPVPAADPYYNAPCPPGPAPGPFTMPPLIGDAQRFLRDVSMDYNYFPGHGSNVHELGINDIDFSATFALPMPFAQPGQQPLTVTPGFDFHYWDGPSSNADGNPDLPARTFDAYLAAGWNPIFSPMFSAELEASYGIYSDFTTLTNQSYRIKGKAMAVIGVPETNMKLKAGVWYLNRGKIKLLPAGGFVWTPSPYTRFDVLFPNPKLTQFLAVTGNTEWWWYLSGEYGGGTWTVKRSADADPAEAGRIDLVDYNDMRVALGLDYKRVAGLGMHGFFEGGYAFNRELIYASGRPETFTPNASFYIHAGVSF